MTKLRLNVMNSERETTESSRLESSDYATDTYYYCARYYDSQTGRFISEDPIKLGGGLNFYEYVGNNPPLYVDPLGLWKNTGILIDPMKNFYPTIVCDGHGGIRVWIPDWYNYPPERAKCVGDCTQQHEQSHARDALKSNPKICAGSADGIQLGYSNLREQNMSETTAYTLELKCLENKKKENTCKDCTPYISDDTKQAQRMLSNLKNGWTFDKNH